MFDYTQDFPEELPLGISYLLDYDEDYKPQKGFKTTLVLYKVDHENKTYTTYKFDHVIAMEEFIIANKIKRVVFLTLGYIGFLRERLAEQRIECRFDCSIYKWLAEWNKNSRRRVGVMYYYETQDYKPKHEE